MDILKKGTPVTVKHTDLTGEIQEAQIIAEQLQYRVSYTGHDGEQHERWFGESEIVVAP